MERLTRQQTSQGLTMAEILVAIMFASVLVVSVLVVLTQLLAGAHKSSDLAGGTIVAEQVLNQVVAESDPVQAAGRTGMLRSVQGDAILDFQYSVDVQPLDKAAPSGAAFLVTVDCWWKVDRPQANRAQVGKLSTRLNRIVYRSEATPQP